MSRVSWKWCEHSLSAAIYYDSLKVMQERKCIMYSSRLCNIAVACSCVLDASPNITGLGGGKGFMQAT